MKKIVFSLILVLTMCLFVGCSKINIDSSSENIKLSDSTNNNSSIEDSEKSDEDQEKDNDKNEENKQDSEDKTNEEKNDDKIESPKKNKNGKFLVCIDAGHQTKGNMAEQEPIGPGSKEMKFKVSGGTQGVATKIPEYELNLSAAKILKQYLLDMGYDVLMVRETNDVNISNSERAIMANQAGADLVIRLHADGSNNPNVSGISLQTPGTGKYTQPIYEESNKAAKIIANDLAAAGFKFNQIYERNDLTGFNWSKVPSVLVEMGFMSNAAEDKQLSDINYQKKMMKCIAGSVKKYLK